MSTFKVFVLASSLLLVACGGGGGGGGSGGDNVLTGQFIDSAVSGIRFETDTRSGITDGDGRFEYLAGERVRFYLGELMLGEAESAAVISVFDLVEGVTPVVGNALQKAIWNWKRGPGFSTVINIATLLQTLDSDGNPDNGIAISADVAALFMPGSVNFDQHWEEFENDRGFRQALNEAKTSALLDARRQIRKPWQVLAHLYASLGIDSKLVVPSSELYEGVLLPSGNSYRSQYQFDTEGQLIRFEMSLDSIAGPVSSFAYDAEGNLSSEDYDADGDGNPERRGTYTYDADGNLSRVEYRDSGGTSSDYDASFTYDIYGNQTSSEFDFDGDGTPDSIDTYAYDAAGNWIRYESDYDADGAPDSIRNYAYDDQGNQIRDESDYDGDGTADRIYTYTYDGEGNQIREEYDSDGDGTADSIYTYTYDGEGNQIREEYDSDGDGTPDSIYTFTYDAGGNWTRYESDYDGDGTLDRIYTYTYDGDGNRIREEYDYYGDGMTVGVFTITYDANGNPLRGEGYDPGNNGTVPDDIFTFSYDPDANGWWWIFNENSIRYGF